MHDVVNPRARSRVRDEAAKPAESESLPHRGGTQVGRRVAFSEELRGIGFAGPENRVNERRYAYPAQEIEPGTRENQDLEHSGTEGKQPRAGMNALHCWKFSKVSFGELRGAGDID
jgi:hypothetical protein